MLNANVIIPLQEPKPKGTVTLKDDTDEQSLELVEEPNGKLKQQIAVSYLLFLQDVCITVEICKFSLKILFHSKK